MKTTQAQPILGKDVYIAETAYVAGDVTIGDTSTVMHHVTIRGDIGAINIGKQVNIQDGTVVHTPVGTPMDIADAVGIGHRAVVHGRRIGAQTLIGIGSILLDDCEIGSHCIIAAGAIVPPKMIVPDHSVVMGIPGRIVRTTTDRDLEIIQHVVDSYEKLGRLHSAGQFPNIAGL